MVVSLLEITGGEERGGRRFYHGAVVSLVSFPVAVCTKCPPWIVSVLLFQTRYCKEEPVLISVFETDT